MTFVKRFVTKFLYFLQADLGRPATFGILASWRQSTKADSTQSSCSNMPIARKKPPCWAWQRITESCSKLCTNGNRGAVYPLLPRHLMLVLQFGHWYLLPPVTPSCRIWQNTEVCASNTPATHDVCSASVPLKVFGRKKQAGAVSRELPATCQLRGHSTIFSQRSSLCTHKRGSNDFGSTASVG